MPYWLKAMEAEHLSCRYITAAPQQWPHTFKYTNPPVALGTYGHQLPFSLEDTMFVFDQLGRLKPSGLHFFDLAKPPSKKSGVQDQLTDRFFCTYLARYLDIPFYFFEISFAKPPSAEGLSLELTHGSDSAKIKHFCLYLDKLSKPNQEQVKQWIRKVYR